jgi:fatty acid desaturase
MYPTVPCYNLHRLHLAVRHDLPPCPNGLIANWREIIGILKIQFSDPAYQHKAPVPSPAPRPPEPQHATLSHGG